MRSLLRTAVLAAVFASLVLNARAEEMTPTYQKATFAGGCFWGIEKVFGEIEGVVATRVGYTGGTLKNPDYHLVCTGKTGHAEAIEVTFDPAKVSYEDLVEFFFTRHDSTTLNRQGNDVGTQYRSAIFYHSPEQKAIAVRAKGAIDKSGIYKKPVTTEIAPAGDFFAAEDYHQKYLQKNPGGYCHINLQSAKISKVLQDLDRKPAAKGTDGHP